MATKKVTKQKILVLRKGIITVIDLTMWFVGFSDIVNRSHVEEFGAAG